MAEMISELIWQPIGAKEDADMTLDHFRTCGFNGGMCATLQGSFTTETIEHASFASAQLIQKRHKTPALGRGQLIWQGLLASCGTTLSSNAEQTGVYSFCRRQAH